MTFFLNLFLVFLSSACALQGLEEINREQINFTSWEEQKIKDFIKSLSNKTVDDVVVFLDKTLSYDEPRAVPELLVLKIFDDSNLKDGQEITAACISRNKDPTSQIIWHLGHDQINISLEFEEDTRDATMSTTVISVIQRNITADDDSKFLICRALHPGFMSGFTETRQKLLVNFKPVQQPVKFISVAQLGDSVDISVSFRSNPKPSSLIWLVGGRKVYYGTKSSKYISREISATGDNYFAATLHIIKLTHHDTLMNYTLRVKNTLGGADYHLRFDGLLR